MMSINGAHKIIVYFGSRSPPARRNRSTVTAKEVHCHGEEVQFAISPMMMKYIQRPQHRLQAHGMKIVTLKNR